MTESLLIKHSAFSDGLDLTNFEDIGGKTVISGCEFGGDLIVTSVMVDNGLRVEGCYFTDDATIDIEDSTHGDE